MIDKNFCMSSYLAFRYVEAEDKDFYEGLHHKNFTPVPPEKKRPVKTAEDIDREMHAFFEAQGKEKLGVMLSGGMDSAIVASYLPKGSDAFTFRFLGGEFQKEELRRAESYADFNHLNLHYVDIDWSVVEQYLSVVMKAKGAPVHSIEPQIYKAALEAKKLGVTKMLVGESADLIFGGMDLLLGKEWKFDEFVKRYTFTDPFAVLEEPVSMNYLFERYRKNGDGIDYLKFMDDVFSIESSSSYYNAFGCAGLAYGDPYAHLVMAEPLDLERVRGGEPKYLVRRLFELRYGKKAPDKVPMPRPVDIYFADWKGPSRKEFKKGLRMEDFTGNQKWQMFCLEQFLNMHE